MNQFGLIQSSSFQRIQLSISYIILKNTKIRVFIEYIERWIIFVFLRIFDVRIYRKIKGRCLKIQHRWKTLKQQWTTVFRATVGNKDSWSVSRSFTICTWSVYAVLLRGKKAIAVFTSVAFHLFFFPLCMLHLTCSMCVAIWRNLEMTLGGHVCKISWCAYY